MLTLVNHDSGDEDLVCWLERVHRTVRSAIPDCPPDDTIVYRVVGAFLIFDPDGTVSSKTDDDPNNLLVVRGTGRF
jgi:hypothetical protein